MFRKQEEMEVSSTKKRKKKKSQNLSNAAPEISVSLHALFQDTLGIFCANMCMQRSQVISLKS